MNQRITGRLMAAVSTAALVLVMMPAAQALPSDGYEADVIKYTNTERTSRDLVAVKSQSCVDKYAERQARKLRDAGKLYHQNLSKVLKACKLSGVSENVAMGFPTGAAAVNGWMKSAGHKKNLLDSKMRLIGVGAAQDSKGVWWVAQVFGRK